MTRYWCELAWLGGPEVQPGVVLHVDDDRILSVETHCDPGEGDSRLDGLTMPALANAHSHAFHRALRGRTHAERGTFWTWRDLMYTVAGTLDPDNYHRLARAAFAEMALAGIAVVGEFHYVHHAADGTPYDDPNAMGAALVAAAQEAGIRLTLLDTLYLHGGFGQQGSADGYSQPDVAQVRFSDQSAETWAARVDDLASAATGPTVRVGAAAHSVRAVDPASIKSAAAWAGTADRPFHVHVSEQPTENELCRATLGRTPVEVLADQGALTSATTLIHATHATASDIGHAASSGVQVCMCPTTERDLADGIGPSAAMAEAGVPICLGSDSHAVVDLLEEARAVELNQRVATLERGVHSTTELAAMATSNGYEALGWLDGGHLRPGALADFVTIDLRGVRLAGTNPQSTLASVLFGGTTSDVAHLVVGGRPVVVGGRHVTLDVAAELASSIAEVTSP